MASSWGDSWGTSWGNSWGDAGSPVVVVEETPARASVEPGGAGAPPGKPHRQHGPHAPAFGRRRGTVIEYPIRDADLVVTPDVEIEKPDAKPAPELQSTSPLPVIMDFGAGPIAMGMQIPLSQQIHNQLMADDEDALIAILLAID